jgi:exopolysaccharide biosynthesis polyprenyl glycosylphosphotransferase
MPAATPWRGRRNIWRERIDGTRRVATMQRSSGTIAPPAETADIARDVRSSPLLRGPAGSALLRRGLSVTILVLIDLTATFLGIYAALAVKLAAQGEPIDASVIWASERKALPLAALALVLVFAKYRLYAPRDQRGGSARILSATALATIAVLVLVLVAGWRFDTYYIFYASWFFVGVGVLALRASYDSVTGFLLEAVHFQRRALVIGPSSLASPVVDALTGSGVRRGVPYRVAGRHELVAGVGDESARGAAASLRQALDPARIDEVIVTGSTEEGEAVIELLEVCRRRGIPVRLAPTPVELLSHSISAVAAPGLPLFELRPPVLTTWAFMAKRAFDVVVASVLLILLSPLLALAALAIWLEDRGPIIHRSRRVGLQEREFTCLKLRTMSVDAEERQDELEAHNEADGALFKIKADPRITRVGAVLRRYSVDELPQLLNVLRGEMSLVGPRPLPVRDFERLSDLHKKRYLVLPGLTGLWQVSGRSNLSFDDLVRLDFYYIDSWSIWLDLTILARTVPVVLFRKGAY